MSGPRDLTPTDRLAFAAEHLALLFERQGSLTDSDVLNVGEDWSLPEDYDDREWLVNALFEWVTQGS